MKKVTLFNAKGKPIKVYPSVKEFCREQKINGSNAFSPCVNKTGIYRFAEGWYATAQPAKIKSPMIKVSREKTVKSNPDNNQYHLSLSVKDSSGKEVFAINKDYSVNLEVTKR